MASIRNASESARSGATREREGLPPRSPSVALAQSGRLPHELGKYSCSQNGPTSGRWSRVASRYRAGGGCAERECVNRFIFSHTIIRRTADRWGELSGNLVLWRRVACHLFQTTTARLTPAISCGDPTP